MSSFTYDFCLLFTNINDFNVVELQTDDILFLSDLKFAEAEEMKLKQADFMTKNREKLSIQHSLKFNECFIQFSETNIQITQKNQCKNLSLIVKKNVSTISFRDLVRSSLTIKKQYTTQ